MLKECMAMTQKFQRQLVFVLKRINNKKGSAILTVMTFIMITVVLVASMLALAQMNLSNSINASERSSAFYVAESALQESVNNVESIFLANNYKTTNLIEQFNKSDSDDDTGRAIVYDNKITGPGPVTTP